MTEAEASPSVRDLRRRWKPTREQLGDSPAHQQIKIRIHRCCSWLQRVEDIDADGSGDQAAGDGALIDAALIYRWIALNSLYGRWDEHAREPLPDRDSLRTFLDQALDHDRDGVVPQVLEDHRRLVMSILDDEYLSRYFWEEPTDERARKSKKAKFSAQTWYLEKRFGLILERLLERIYFQRCQLVHGAATFGSSLNRTALRRCSIMLGHLLRAVLIVLIDHGYEADWGLLCYPPQS